MGRLWDVGCEMWDVGFRDLRFRLVPCAACPELVEG
jgi:hypothetical protein